VGEKGNALTFEDEMKIGESLNERRAERWRREGAIYGLVQQSRRPVRLQEKRRLRKLGRGVGGEEVEED